MTDSQPILDHVYDHMAALIEHHAVDAESVTPDQQAAPSNPAIMEAQGRGRGRPPKTSRRKAGSK